MELTFSESKIKLGPAMLYCQKEKKKKENNLKRTELHTIYNLEETHKQKQPPCFKVIGIRQNLKKKKILGLLVPFSQILNGQQSQCGAAQVRPGMGSEGFLAAPPEAVPRDRLEQGLWTKFVLKAFQASHSYSSFLCFWGGLCRASDVQGNERDS